MSVDVRGVSINTSFTQVDSGCLTFVTSADMCYMYLNTTHVKRRQIQGILPYLFKLCMSELLEERKEIFYSTMHSTHFIYGSISLLLEFKICHIQMIYMQK